ncbi:MAG: DUF5305 family protein [Thermacetogeniaceae bacterium]
MSAKKIVVAESVRAAVTVVLGLLFAGALCYGCAVFRKPAFAEKKVAVLSYRQKGVFSYSVRIRPNSIFPEERRGPGETYFTKVVKAIDVDFSYLFKTDREAALTAIYSVVATVDAPKMWQKEFVLVPPTEVAAKGDTLSINRPFAIDLPYYNDFLKAANEELGATPGEPRLVVKAPVEVKAVSPEGVVKDRLAPEMIIPLQSGCFKVSGDLLPEKRGELTVLRRVADTSLGRKKRLAGVFLAATGLLLLLWQLVTKGERGKADDGSKRQLESFLRACGDRIVQAQTGFTMPDEALIVPLSSPEDLVRVADELGKPVVFQPCGAHGQPCYLVFDGTTAYRYIFADHPDQAKAVGGSRRVKLKASGSADIPVSRG